MQFRLSKFVVNVCNFCESKYRKIHIAFVQRINLFQYCVFFVRL
jgi:hypothetical protein